MRKLIWLRPSFSLKGKVFPKEALIRLQAAWLKHREEFWKVEDWGDQKMGHFHHFLPEGRSCAADMEGYIVSKVYQTDGSSQKADYCRPTGDWTELRWLESALFPLTEKIWNGSNLCGHGLMVLRLMNHSVLLSSQTTTTLLSPPS